MKDNSKSSYKRIEYILPVFLMVVMILLVFVQVIFRYIINNPLGWPEEVCRWLVVWVTFAGASYSFKNGALISIDYFVKKLLPNYEEAIHRFDSFVTFIFYVLFAASGFLYTMRTIKSNLLTPVTKVPIAIVNSAVFIGALLVIIDFCKGNIQNN